MTSIQTDFETAKSKVKIYYSAVDRISKFKDVKTYGRRVMTSYAEIIKRSTGRRIFLILVRPRLR